MPVSRRLVAVVVADVAGYSRLMEHDEAGTHERLRELRTGLIDPKIAEHGGRVVKTSGDGMLLEFPSATSALRCAVEIQREMGVRNLYLAPDARIELRIGINLGDIIVEGAVIVGDGVNVAARLETLAEPGGICVASAIWEQVHEDLGIEFIDAGEQQVKNISKPIHVYRVALGKGAASGPTAAAPMSPAGWSRLGGRRAAIVAATIAAVTLLGAVIGLWLARQPPVPATAVDETPLRSVLLLPFEAAPGDPALAETARRLTADVTRALGDSMSDVRVAPAVVAAEWAGKGAEPRATGRGANVRFLIQGDLRPAGTQVAVTLRLVDARDGRQVHTERRTVERDRLDDYDALARQLTSASRVMLMDAVSAAVVAPGQSAKASAQDLITRAFSLTNSDPAVQAREQRKLADEAIKLDPNFAGAWSIRAGSSLLLYLSDFSVDRERLLAEADADSLRAVTLDSRDAFAWATRGSVLGFRGNTDAAFAANDRARELDPTRFFPVLLRGYLYVQAGRPAEALEMVELMQRGVGTLGPDSQELACRAHVALGNYDAAIAACERAAAAIQSWALFANLTAAYAMRGDMEKAAQAKAQLLKIQPAFTIGRFEAKRFSTVPAAVAQDREHGLAGLRKAGVPE